MGCLKAIEDLKRVYELKYEDYVEEQDRYHKEIAAFIGTQVPEPPKEDTYRYVAQWGNPTGFRVPEKGMEKTSPIHNHKYLNRWRKLLIESPFRVYYRYLARKMSLGLGDTIALGQWIAQRG